MIAGTDLTGSELCLGGNVVRYVAGSNHPAARLADRVRSVAANHGVPPAAVAPARPGAQPTVAVPIASARTVDQLRQITPMAQLQLGEDDLRLPPGG